MENFGEFDYIDDRADGTVRHIRTKDENKRKQF